MAKGCVTKVLTTSFGFTEEGIQLAPTFHQ